MAETKARHIANLVEDDGDVKSAHLDNITVTPTAVSDQANTSTGYLDLPAGTTAQRPTLNNAGGTRYNSDTGSLEFYDGTNWVATNLIPTINSITGTIYAGVSSTLTLSVTNTTSTIDVKYYEGNTLLATEAGRTVSNNSATSTVPSAVFNQTAGDTITIQVLNTDATPSNNINKTVLALPSGGTITPPTNSYNYYVHTFTQSGTFTNTINNLSVDYLVIGGGGGGGNRRAGGGGGGGYRCSVTNESSGRGASAEPTLTMAGTSSGTAFDIEVGGGGAGSTSEHPPGTDGQPSFIRLQGAGSTYLVYSNGGGGGASANYPTEGAANNGGCGGGAGSAYGNSSRSGGDGTTGQGYDGGDATGTTNTGAGGGGGAGNHGSAGGTNAGNGGPGVTSSINGTPTGRAGGGGGGCHTTTIGTGSDGGGDGGKTGGPAPTAGVDGKGGGGGGGDDGSPPGRYGADGGDGIVIMRYQLP
tara:strand:+ start:8584 stop:9999 length:1416 start_codon:yes stop_codon:yes gene_type:complete